MKDVLAGFFGIVALWRYVVFAQRENSAGKKSFIDPIGTAALVVAMLSKPSAMVIPAIALVMDWLLLRRRFSEALRATAVWFAVAGGCAIVARLAQQVDDSLRAPLWARPMIAGDALLFYSRKLLVPLNLGLDYGRTPSVVMEQPGFRAMWLVPVFTIAMFLAARRRHPWLCAAGLIFLIAILPTSGLFTFQYQYTSTTADHYLYIAMLGPALAIAFLVGRFPSRGVIGGMFGIVVILGAVSFHQAQYWRNDVALFSRAVAVNPQSFVAHNNLGIAYLLQHNDAAAADEFRESIRLSDEFPPAYENLARALGAQGDIDGSIHVIEKSIDIRAKLPRSKYPNYMEDHNVVGQILLQRGRYAKAIAHFQALLAINPDHADAKKFLKIARERLAQTRPATTQAADPIRPGASGKFSAPR